MITINDFRIYCLDNSDRADWEALNKGYRSDIYVKTDSRYYHLYVYDIVRLQQDFETEVKEYGYYSVDPNVVIVPEVEWGYIKQTIAKLKLQLYFERILPVAEEKVPLQDLKER